VGHIVNPIAFRIGKSLNWSAGSLYCYKFDRFRYIALFCLFDFYFKKIFNAYGNLTLLTTILKKKLTGGGSINYFNDLRNELLELKAVKTNLLNTDERVFNFKPFFSKLIYYNLNFHFFSRYVFLELRFFNSYLTFVQEDFYTRSWVAWRLAGCSKQTDKQVFDYFYEDAALAAVSRFSTSPGFSLLPYFRLPYILWN
jgi:hypothetical protein